MEILSERKKAILYEALEDYIKDATPITSLAVHKKAKLNVSPATLRNELNALEAMGYLKQLHTSGGRVPTTKAYRLFVNELMQKSKFDKKSIEQVREIVNTRTTNLNEAVTNVANLISKVTNYPIVVMMDGYNNLVVNSIKIIPLIDGSGIVLIGTESGIINNQINFNKKIPEETCIDASSFLTKKFKGKTLGEIIVNIEEISKNLDAEIAEFGGLLNNLLDCLSSMLNGSKNVYTTGTSRLLEAPDYTNVKEVKKVLEVLEDKEKVKEILNEDIEGSVSYTIGEENTNEALESCSIVKANYKVNGASVAKIGVVGPERMDYSKIASALKYIMKEIDDIYLLPSENGDK